MLDMKECIASGEPWMPSAERDVLARALAGCRAYLEYGAGGSTVLALRLGVPEVITVESDPACLALVQAAFRSRPDGTSFLPVLITDGVKGGGPRPEYALAPWRALAAGNGRMPELILIDGRFRVACFLACLVWGRPGTTLLFDDYFDRPAYRVAERFCPVTARHGRMAVFHLSRILDPLEVKVHLFMQSGDRR